MSTDESDVIRVARATRQSRRSWGFALMVVGVIAAVIGAAVYSSKKEPTLDQRATAAVAALACIDGTSCDYEDSEAVAERDARPYLMAGLGAGGVLLLLGLVIVVSAPSVPEPRPAASDG